jgi:hypothetical protein
MAYDTATPAEKPNRAARRSEKRSDEQVEALVRTMIDDAQSYIESEVAPEREKAIDYYYARPFGNEEEGRSQIVTTDVRDAVRSVMPSLLRIFTGPERYVEFGPRGKEDEAIARQKTDYINYCIIEDNSGFRIFHGWFKDALVQKIGFVKWWWDESEETESTEYTGLTEENIMELLAEDDVELEITDTVPPDPAKHVPETFDATVTRTTTKGRLRIECVPSEEILWDRNARNFGKSARIVVHTREARVDELLAMGYEYEDFEECIGASSYHQGAREDDARRIDEGANKIGDEVQDDLTEPVRYDEAFVYLEDPSDGKVKLFKVCTAGDQHKMLAKKVVSHRPIAYLICDPEAHAIGGLSYADDTMDFQEMNSAISRGMLDSLSLALIPRTEAVDGMVNLQDLMNTEIGAVIRTRAPGMIREIAHRFVGGDILPAYEILAEMKENRLGQSKAAAGLDADALQSSTKAAVAATLSKAQERTELLARIFAETGVREMYKGLLRTVVEHQDRSRTVRLRGQYVEIDPSGWEADADVIVNIALGAGLADEKARLLAAIIEKQEAVLQQLGPQNPLVSLTQYRNALARAVELLGYPNADEFFKPLSEDEEKKLAQQAAQQPPPQDPATQALAQAEMAKVQIEAQRVQATIENEKAKLALEREKMMLADDRERDKQAADVVLKKHELEMKYKNSLDRAQLDAEVKRERALLDANAKVDAAEVAAEAEPATPERE